MTLSKTSSLIITVLGLIIAIAGAACYFYADISDTICYVIIALGVIVLIAGAYLYYRARKYQ